MLKNLVSIISTVLMVLLFLSELSTFLEIKVGSEMAVDVNRGGEKVIRNLILNNNFNIKFYDIHNI